MKIGFGETKDFHGTFGPKAVGQWTVAHREHDDQPWTVIMSHDDEQALKAYTNGLIDGMKLLAGTIHTPHAFDRVEP